MTTSFLRTLGLTIGRNKTSAMEIGIGGGPNDGILLPSR